MWNVSSWNLTARLPIIRSIEFNPMTTTQDHTHTYPKYQPLSSTKDTTLCHEISTGPGGIMTNP
jgi:hypothetical protein